MSKSVFGSMSISSTVAREMLNAMEAIVNAQESLISSLGQAQIGLPAKWLEEDVKACDEARDALHEAHDAVETYEAELRKG